LLFVGSGVRLVRICMMTKPASSPVKGSFPVTARKRITASDQRFDRWSMRLDCWIYSGLKE
jgi:hypothetical protein